MCCSLPCRLYAISRCPHLKVLDWKKVKQKVRYKALVLVLCFRGSGLC